MPKVEKIQGLNLAGTPRATSTGHGRPLLFTLYVLLSDEPLMKNMLQRMWMEAIITVMRMWDLHGGTEGMYC